MDRAESIVRQIDKSKGVMREAGDREVSASSKAIGGIIDYITNKVNYMEG